jgi:hypothetical protein
VKETVISYEKRWYNADGRQMGASRFWGPPMKAGDAQLEEGLQIWYKCTICQDWFIIPQGYEVEEEGAEED